MAHASLRPTNSFVYAVMLRHWLGMPIVIVSLHETPVWAAKGCKKSFGGDMLSVMVTKYDVSSVVVNFQKFGIAFESSCAFGRQALSLWAELKYAAAEIGHDNYIVSVKPHTWSAFTFEQMLP